MAKQITLSGLTKRFQNIIAVDTVDLEIPAGEFVTLVGPSGSGKTTLLRMIAGLETPSEGEIWFDGEDLTDASPQDRPLSMVFQNIALYPHMSCRENIGYGLKIKGVAPEERKERIEEAAESLQIGDQLDKQPAELSGGQQQRVALGRAFVENPEVLLFDEPMSDLDAKLKEDLRTEFQRLHRRLDATFVYVTHDQNEAMAMSDKIAVMKNGAVEQFDSPERIFHDPVSEYVATFIGTPSTNVIVDETTGNGRGYNISLPPAVADYSPVRMGIRPQYLSRGDNDLTLEVTVDVMEPMGTEYVVHTTMGDSFPIEFVTSNIGDLQAGESITIGASIDDIYFFDERGDRIVDTTGLNSASGVMS